MRYLTPRFAVSALGRGVSIEQFLGPIAVDGREGVRWVTLHPGEDRIEVMEHAAEIVDRDGFGDLDNLPPLYDDEVRAWGWIVGVAHDAQSALALARELVGAVDERWVNFGVAGEDYIDYVRQR
jgi:hypothetical protein